MEARLGRVAHPPWVGPKGMGGGGATGGVEEKRRWTKIGREPTADIVVLGVVQYGPRDRLLLAGDDAFGSALATRSNLFQRSTIVRWATGKRLTIRLPNLNLISLSPHLPNSGVLGLRTGPYVPTVARSFSQSLGTQEECFIRFLT